MKKFDYQYFENLDDLKKFANSSNVTIVSVMPNNHMFYKFIACYYKNDSTND